ncbi:MAG: glycosyltransferase [Candidatus Pristimantibacillus sp.]
MRDSNPSRMIQQQMYARERSGIFRTTEGYDTIAKSSGLDPSFIKKVLHPLCVYDAPEELAVSGEKDEAAYPETMHLLHMDNGDIVLGRSIYQATDFTGLRSAFFTHNYLIPSGADKESANDYRSWLQASFESSYNIDGGTEVAELTSLPIQPSASVQPSYQSILALLNINENRFKQLLYAVMAAVGGKKKVYVALDVPIKQLPIMAKQLLSVLYASLPYAYREKLGFITYAKEPLSRKSVHLTFVERGSLRAADRSIEKDYTFDLANDRIMNVDLNGMDQPYLDFAWDQLLQGQTDRADRFFQFAELMLADMEPERAITAASYHELCVLFQIEEGNESLYEAHKTTVLRGLLDYLQPVGALDSKIRLNDLFLSRFDYEYDQVRLGQVPEHFIIDAIKEYYRVDPGNENKIVAFFILALNNAIKQSREEDAAYFYAAIESSPTLRQAFFSKLMADSRLMESLFIPFLEKKLGAAVGVKSVLQLIEQWGIEYPQLFGIRQFRTLANKLLMDKLRYEGYSITAVSKTFELLRRLEGEASSGKKSSSYEAVNLYQELELAAYRTLLIELNLDRLTKEQLVQADFLGFKDQLQRWDAELNDPRQKSSALKLLAVYEWFALPEPTADLFARLSPTEMDRVQQVGRQLLSGQIELVDFTRLVLAFLRSSDRETIDYALLIDYLQKNAASKETIYRFFQWSEKHPDFMRSRGFVPAYTAAIVGYFKKYDRDAFKKRTNWKQHFDKAGSTLKAVYKQADRELSSSLMKLFRRNRKAAMITSIATLGIIIAIAGVMLSMSDKGEPEKEGVSVPEVQPTADVSLPELSTVVYAEQTAAAAGEEATTSLVFLFNDVTACGKFAPTSLIVEPPGGEAVTYSELELFPTCLMSVQTPEPTDASAEADTGNKEVAATNDAEVESGTTGAGSLKSSTEPGLSSDQPSATPGLDSDQSSATPLPESSIFDPTDYPFEYKVNLGKQADIAENSVIRIGEEQYQLFEAPNAEQ